MEKPPLENSPEIEKSGKKQFEAGQSEVKSEKLADFDYQVFISSLTHYDEHPLHMEQLPSKIETGKIGDSLNKIYRKTDEDPERRERGGVVLKGLNNRILIKNIPTIGEKYYVDLAKMYKNRPPGSISIILHSHPYDVIASAEDLSFLVAEERSPYSANAMMTATGGLNVLFLRTAETRTISRHLKEGWVEEVSKDMLEQQKQVSIGFTLLKRQQKRFALESLENNKIVGEICKKHSIAVYTSKPGETEFTRADLI